mmetsp:Transcript_20286/g.60811  ORF Transcript_20286/g.60811 Transcript_20286/m.60811 type:complete len:375 (-) Transcript_20286:433-1557(-)
MVAPRLRSAAEHRAAAVQLVKVVQQLRVELEEPVRRPLRHALLVEVGARGPARDRLEARRGVLARVDRPDGGVLGGGGGVRVVGAADVARHLRLVLHNLAAEVAAVVVAGHDRQVLRPVVLVPRRAQVLVGREDVRVGGVVVGRAVGVGADDVGRAVREAGRGGVLEGGGADVGGAERRGGLLAARLHVVVAPRARPHLLLRRGGGELAPLPAVLLGERRAVVEGVEAVGRRGVEVVEARRRVGGAGGDSGARVGVLEAGGDALVHVRAPPGGEVAPLAAGLLILDLRAVVEGVEVVGRLGVEVVEARRRVGGAGGDSGARVGVLEAGGDALVHVRLPARKVGSRGGAGRGGRGGRGGGGGRSVGGGCRARGGG